MAAARRRELDIPRNVAATLGRSAVEAAVNGYYFNTAGGKVDWSHLVSAACSAKRSIPFQIAAVQMVERSTPERTRSSCSSSLPESLEGLNPPDPFGATGLGSAAIRLSLRLADHALSRLYTDGRRQKRIGRSTTPRRRRHVTHRHYGAGTAQAMPPPELSLPQ
jgi:hypothetical protein